MSGGRQASAPLARSLGAQIDAWLGELYEPLRTKTGAVSKRKGRIDYGDEAHGDFCRRFLGVGVMPAPFFALRKDLHVGGIVRMAARTAVERRAAGLDVELLVRRDAFRNHAAAGIRHFRSFGTAPDGGDLVGWLERLSVRHNACDVVLLEEAEALEGGDFDFFRGRGAELRYREDFPHLRARLAEFDEVPLSLRAYILADGRFVFGEDSATTPSARSVLRQAFEGRLCQMTN